VYNCTVKKRNNTLCLARRGCAIATDRQLHRLRREELLEILLEIEQENEQLTDENLRLRQQLAKKELAIQEAGSIAEAAMRLSKVFEAAQEAADIYLLNVRRLADGSMDAAVGDATDAGPHQGSTGMDSRANPHADGRESRRGDE